LKENYKSKSLNEQFIEAKAIPKDERENSAHRMEEKLTIIGPNGGGTAKMGFYTIIDEKNRDIYKAQTLGLEVGVAARYDVGISTVFIIDSSISKPDELESVNINLSADVEIVKNLLGAEGTLSYDLKSGTINTGATLDFDITPDKIKNIGD